MVYGFSHSRYRNPARDAKLDELYTADEWISRPEIARQLNLIPGAAEAKASDIDHWARKLNLTRRAKMPVGALCGWRTDERNRVMNLLYPTFTSKAAIVAEINKLPGKPLGEHALSYYAEILGLARPDGYSEQARLANTGRLKSLVPALPDVAPEPTETDLETVTLWAYENAIEPRTLSAVNAERRKWGLPEFRVKKVARDLVLTEV